VLVLVPVLVPVLAPTPQPATARPWKCGAIVDLLALQQLAPMPQLDEAKGLLVRVVGMLTKMCQ